MPAALSRCSPPAACPSPLQGKFEYGRRNYGSLWEQMMELKAKDPAMLNKVGCLPACQHARLLA